MHSAFLHVRALILNEDSAARELASKSGFVKVASDLLRLWSQSDEQDPSQVPKWVTLAFIAIDRLAQVDTKLNADMIELLKKNEMGNQASIVIDEDKQNEVQKNLDIKSERNLLK
ncbi:hypothetical protein ACS0TY_006286 [Phlomoides rotata]